MSVEVVWTVSGAHTSEKSENRLPALAEVHGGGEEDDLERGIDGIDAVVKELTQRATLPRPARLRAIDGVKRLVQEESNGPACVHPRRAVLIERRRVPEQCQKVCDDEAKTGERDLFTKSNC